MTLDQAAAFFVCSILAMLAFVTIAGGVVIINNILHHYWKPVQLFKFLDHPYPPRFITPQEAAANKKPNS